MSLRDSLQTDTRIHGIPIIIHTCTHIYIYIYYINYTVLLCYTLVYTYVYFVSNQNDKSGGVSSMIQTVRYNIFSTVISHTVAMVTGYMQYFVTNSHKCTMYVIPELH